MKASPLWLLGVFILTRGVVNGAEPAPTNTVRVAAAQAAKRLIDFHLKPAEALAAVEKNLSELEKIVARAGEAKCDALVLPEDTPGVLNWERWSPLQHSLPARPRWQRDWPLSQSLPHLVRGRRAAAGQLVPGFFHT